MVEAAARRLKDDRMIRVRFSSEEGGLNASVHPLGDPSADGLERALIVESEVSRDHGVVTIPVRLPRHLAPHWSPDAWEVFFRREANFLCSHIDESLLLYLSLAMSQEQGHRRQLLKDAEQVVIDFRGDLPNKLLPMTLGGYKIGVYRRGQDWPAWLSIQPSQVDAFAEARRIRQEAGLAKSKAWLAPVGKLRGFVQFGVQRFGMDRIRPRDLVGFLLTGLFVGGGIGAAVMWLFN
jgi:hypothetical protein